MTDACLVESKLRHQICHPVWRRARSLPLRRGPELDARQRADEHDVALDLRIVAQRLSEDEAPLRVERYLFGIGEEVTHERAVAGVLTGRRLELSAELRPG